MLLAQQVHAGRAAAAAGGRRQRRSTASSSSSRRARFGAAAAPRSSSSTAWRRTTSVAVSCFQQPQQQPGQQQPEQQQPGQQPSTPPAPAGAAFDEPPAAPAPAPRVGGVETATSNYHLPPPAVAVRNLVEQAQFAHLCTVMSHMHNRRAGYPFGTLVDFAVDGAGMPVLCLSPLAIHARNLVEDPRCSLIVQMPGWTGLADARVTIFGDLRQLPDELQPAARDLFLAKNRHREHLPLNRFFRMARIHDVLFEGGFGTVQFLSPGDYLGAAPDAVAAAGAPAAIAALNARFGGALAKRFGAAEAAVISVDALGVDVRLHHVAGSGSGSGSGGSSGSSGSSSSSTGGSSGGSSGGAPHRCGAGGGEYQVERLCFGGARVETAAEAAEAVRAALDAGGSSGGGSKP